MKTRIGILGIGGIGGFIGAPLAEYYKVDNKEGIEVIFICRGDTKREIERNGLTLKSHGSILNVRPHLVSDSAKEIGVLDILLIATKSHSLLKAIQMYRSCLNQNSTVITLQNMVNASAIIKGTYKKEFNVLEGCIYVASNIKAPGHIEHLGGPGKIFIGNGNEKKYERLSEHFSTAGIDMSYAENISLVLWKKYLFVAPVAAMTTAYNMTFGQILEDKTLIDTLENMMLELKALAHCKGIELQKKDVKNAMNLLSKFPYEAKSSLQLDYEKQSFLNEKYYLIDYIIEELKNEKVGYPNYKLVASKIK